MTPEWALPGAALLVLIVVGAIRFGIAWGRAKQRIEGDLRFTSALPSPTAMPGMFDDEPELPYKPAVPPTR